MGKWISFRCTPVSHTPDWPGRSLAVICTGVLSEQGYHTAERDPDAEMLQAAAIVYARRKMQPFKSIEAFHYHRWIDHEREGGLNLGLWTVKNGSTTWPERKKRSWQVYQALGTPKEAQACAFATEYFAE